jgi:hypothetical protein
LLPVRSLRCHPSHEHWGKERGGGEPRSLAPPLLTPPCSLEFTTYSGKLCQIFALVTESEKSSVPGDRGLGGSQWVMIESTTDLARLYCCVLSPHDILSRAWGGQPDAVLLRQRDFLGRSSWSGPVSITGWCTVNRKGPNASPVNIKCLHPPVSLRQPPHPRS